MGRPRLTAWGLCVDGARVLVQFSADEAFFRLPGGTIEWGETAAEALERELHEEYELASQVGELVMVYENLFANDGRRRHEVVLVHSFSCELPPGGIRHREHNDVHLDWRSPAQLDGRATSPARLALVAFDPPHHLRSEAPA